MIHRNAIYGNLCKVIFIYEKDERVFNLTETVFVSYFSLFLLFRRIFHGF